MNKFQPKQVIVTSLTLAMLLGGSALYTTKQQAFAETPDTTVKQFAPSDQKKAERNTHKKELKDELSFAKGKMPIIEEASAILGIDKETLTIALKDKTLVDIAKEKGISEADLISKLQAERGKKIDEAVQAGTIKAEDADKIKAKMAQHLTFMVNHKNNASLHEGSGKKKDKHGILPAPDKLAAILGITADELKAEMKAGKSLAEVAQSKGISKEQLIKQIKEEIAPWIDQAVDRKKGKASTTPEAS
ncbi:hypothetical protein [Paenibacillus agricola]|uniref:LysM domain-containing protein n=1 Tax=Paenibacillus agricola TaxID=2716264 RepID=A0ABX0IZ79_9BACL|nr:hypothetical protein [Paenibacillus agricola]NHN28525.1 hypothetical protein [Paenibacillus agricola]